MTTWTKDDFVIQKGLLICLSERGAKKLRNTDTLVIPEGVTSIVREAFLNIPIKKLVLPLSLRTIGESAFKHTGLEEIEGGEMIEEIHNFAFKDNNLKTVTNFLNLKKIGIKAFSKNKINNFYFSNNLSGIGMSAFEDNRLEDLDFSHCKDVIIEDYAFNFNSIKSIKFGKNVKVSAEALRFNKLKNTNFVDADISEPIQYSEEAKPDNSWQEKHFVIRGNAFVNLTEEGFKKLEMADNITFPSIEGVDRIEIIFSRMTFDYTFQFTEVYISEGIEEIACGAFALRAVEKIHLPESLKLIEQEAFSYTSIKSIKFPKNLEEIDYKAFSSSKLQSVDLSELEITQIPDSCFDDCWYLKEVKLPESLDSIENCAFLNTYSLQRITIPENVQWIGTNAFNASRLEEIEIEGPYNLTVIQNSAFRNSRLKYFPFEKMDYLEIIGFNAFERNDIEEVVIKDGDEIRGHAFKNNKIKKVEIKRAAHLSEEAFVGNDIKDFNISDDVNIVDDDLFWS